MSVIVGAPLAPRAVTDAAPDIMGTTDFLGVCPLAHEKTTRFSRSPVFIAGASTILFTLFFAAMLAELGVKGNSFAAGRTAFGCIDSRFAMFYGEPIFLLGSKIPQT